MMKKYIATFLLLLFWLPTQLLATEFTIIVNGEQQTIDGELQTIDGIEYIITTDCTFKVTSKNELQIGDVNQDSSITIDDVIMLVDVLKGAETNFLSSLANVNQDSMLSIDDIIALVDILKGTLEKTTIVVSYEVEEVISDDWIYRIDSDGPVDQA